LLCFSYISLWALYFWCCVPFVYCASFIFNSPIRAYTALATWNIVMVLVAMVFTWLVGAFVSPALKELLYNVAYLVLPSLPLGEGMIKIAMFAHFPAEAEVKIQSMQKLWLFMFISGVLFWSLLFIIQSRTVKLLWHHFSCHFHRSTYQMVSFSSASCR
jgi:hypothetical protein